MFEVVQGPGSLGVLQSNEPGGRRGEGTQAAVTRVNFAKRGHLRATTSFQTDTSTRLEVAGPSASESNTSLPRTSFVVVAVYLIF